MYSIVSTAIVHGIESVPVCVEADVSDGMPVFEMVGFLSAEVREARERVRTALKNSGYVLPPKRITINLSPAYVRKSGSSFDLPIAMAVLAAMGVVQQSTMQDMLIIGEISLNGKIQPVHGVLPIVAAAREGKLRACMVPADNYKEAMLVEGVRIVAVESLQEAIDLLNSGRQETHVPKEQPEAAQEAECIEKYLDFAEINGQDFVKRACEVAVSGMHNLLMIGPPGAGKTMVAQRIPSILPLMESQEQLELSKIYSVCGLFAEKGHLLSIRPFRSPHHTITLQGLAGGGSIPKPGEISLAHKGVLFLDELPEFKRETVEVLRQPLEEHKVRLVRLRGNYEFPADFMLVCAMNPCRCGYYPDLNRCTCSRSMVEQYIKKISQPLLDRIDICVEAKRVDYYELTEEKGQAESSATIRKRVEHAFSIQRARFAGTDICYNSRIPAAQIPLYCRLGELEQRYMEKMYKKLNLTARTYHKILKVARTVADLDGQADIMIRHLNEAVCYRNVDKKFWEG